MKVALVHDYLTQRGGAERVALSMANAFPDAPLYTAFYDPALTYPEFREVDVRPLAINRFSTLRRDHRRALPFLASAFGRLVVDADVVLCSSSGWAHGVRTEGKKIVYCYTPARWLYQSERYVRETSRVRRAGLSVLRQRLTRWDSAAAATAWRYLAISSAVRDRILHTYGIKAEVLAPPSNIDVGGEVCSLDLAPGFFLCVARLLPYKNVDAVLGAFSRLPSERLVVVGSGPDLERLRALAPSNATFIQEISDAELRWLYANSSAVVSAAYEDFGLTPVEGGSFGKPSVVLRYGGFLDTVREGLNGVFFDEPEPEAIARAVALASQRAWEGSTIRGHSELFAPEVFVARLRSIVEDTGRS